MNTKNRLSAVIVDDEPTAIKLMRYRLNHAKVSVDILADTRSSRSALKIIRATKPDVAFLDIQMPPPNGLEIARLLAAEVETKFVFVTAFDNHALEAFEVSAVDYLLKPIDEERLDATLEKLLDQSLQSQKIQAIELLLQHMGANMRPVIEPASNLLVQDGSNRLVVPIGDISIIEVSGDYASIYYGQQRAFVRESLAALLGRLPDRLFVQTHRSSAVNISCIKNTFMQGSDLYLLMTDDRKVKVSRSRKAVVLSLLQV